MMKKLFASDFDLDDLSLADDEVDGLRLNL